MLISRFLSLMLCIGFVSSLFAGNPPIDSLIAAAEGRVFAGIEVGAKGVKMSVIREKKVSGQAPEIAPLLEQSTNTDLASVSQQAIISTAWAVRSYLDTLRETYHLPKKAVFIVVSSGAKIALEKAGKIEELRQAIRYAIDEPGRELFYVRPEQEAELMAAGTIALEDQKHAALCDIGGGNTKGGRFTDGIFQPFSLPYGTRSILNAVPATDSVPVLAERLDSLYINKLKAEYTKIATSPSFNNIRTIYISGGIYWIAATFLYPEKIESGRVELSVADLERFVQMVETDFNTLSNPVYNKVHPQAAAIEKALNSARSTYDRKALLGGANLAYGLVKALSEAQGGQVTFVFDRYASLSWIRGLVRQTAQNGGQPMLAVLQ